jgi:hypothetical protein
VPLVRQYWYVLACFQRAEGLKYRHGLPPCDEADKQVVSGPDPPHLTRLQAATSFHTPKYPYAACAEQEFQTSATELPQELFSSWRDEGGVCGSHSQIADCCCFVVIQTERTLYELCTIANPADVTCIVVCLRVSYKLRGCTCTPEHRTDRTGSYSPKYPFKQRRVFGAAVNDCGLASNIW